MRISADTHRLQRRICHLAIGLQRRRRPVSLHQILCRLHFVTTLCRNSSRHRYDRYLLHGGFDVCHGLFLDTITRPGSPCSCWRGALRHYLCQFHGRDVSSNRECHFSVDTTINLVAGYHAVVVLDELCHGLTFGVQDVRILALLVLDQVGKLSLVDSPAHPRMLVGLIHLPADYRPEHERKSSFPCLLRLRIRSRRLFSKHWVTEKSARCWAISRVGIWANETSTKCLCDWFPLHHRRRLARHAWSLFRIY